MRVPDVDPSDLPKVGLFSMAAGDFLTVYDKPGTYHFEARHFCEFRGVWEGSQIKFRQNLYNQRAHVMSFVHTYS